MSGRRIDILIVDDSEVVRMLLAHLLEGDPRLRVVGSVDGGAAALEFMAGQKPHVVLMDIHMDGMDGFEVARKIMETKPVPIVMCSGISDPREVATVFRAYDAGAVAVVEKPAAFGHPNHERLARELVDTVRLMSEVRVVRRWPRDRHAPAAPAPPSSVTVAAAGRTGKGKHVVGIGASTGGPPALQTVLSGLTKDFPAPILVVQHITAGFLPGLAEWLGQATPLQVQIATQGVEVRPGHVYLAPDDFHLGLDAGGRIRLTREAVENGLRPAVDHLFRSLSHCCGSDAIGVLLTGMGRDGARELKGLRDRGGTTLVQDQASSVVHGMPGAALAIGAAGQVLPIERIADALNSIVADKKTRVRT